MDVAQIAAWMADFNDQIQANKEYLTELDREIGDSDHGVNMARGMAAVVALDPGEFADAGAYVKKIGMTLVSTVGGASGPLYGTFFLRFSAKVGDGVVAAFRAGLDGVVARGKAERGEKTMIDALGPAVDAMEAAGSETEALAAGAEAATKGRDEAIEYVARKGRASYLGERSKGHMDPGSASATYLVEAAARTLA